MQEIASDLMTKDRDAVKDSFASGIFATTTVRRLSTTNESYLQLQIQE